MSTEPPGKPSFKYICVCTHTHIHTHTNTHTYILCLVTQSCLTTLDNPKDCSLPGSSVYWDSPGKNTGVGCHALLQGIVPTQGSNPVIPHCRQILYQLNYQGSPYIYTHTYIYRHIYIWNQDRQGKYQQPQRCRWYHSNGRKLRGTKESLDKVEGGEWKHWLKTKY